MTSDSLAAYFGVAPEIAHFIPDLLVDFFELGSYPETLVQLARRAGLSSGAHVVDLGCGKGAVALTMARDIGVRVHGIDAMAPFITEARQRAREQGLDPLCEFTCEDLRNTVERDASYDAALFVSVGEVLGDNGSTVGAIRRIVRPGGLIIVDDGWTERPCDLPGYATMTSHREVVRQLTSHGDEIVEELVYEAGDIRRMNALYQARIEAQVQRLSAAHPEHADAFRAYLEREKAENRVLDSDVVGASWVLRRK
ncbi:MAG: SAM-dependent methyltransferase [Myxococcota bacterium]